MSVKSKREVDAVTRARQARAADPNLSAWVTANAGSGKTHVLTQRVIRLLLDKVPPAKILCLTFTKAAAANMSTRVFRTLAGWTNLSDEALTREILATGADKVEPGALAFARALFARTIETPGGLKIQTIHAFCERLLHLFPFEANVPAGFRVLDDREAADLLRQARADAIADSERDPELKAAIEGIARVAGADGFDDLLGDALKTRGEIAAYGGADAYRERLRARLGLDEEETEAELKRRMLEDGGGPARWRRWAKPLNESSKSTDRARGSELLAAAAAPDPEVCFDLLKQAFFNRDWAPTQRLATKEAVGLFRGLDEELREEQDRLGLLNERRFSAAALARSVALVRVADSVLGAYARVKNARGALDFSDLVERTLALVRNADAAWVLYKLDRGIEHILVDEAQDTSRAQWDILDRLAEEFLSGEGASPARRTFFAVGDEKQSIFSFQGAEPALFDAMRRSYERRHASAGRPFARVPLHLSFRSSKRVLDAVDLIFAEEQAWRGVSAGEPKAPKHDAHHVDLPGEVEIWDPIEPPERADPQDWRLPLDAQSGRDPPVRIAERIAETISQWLAPGSNVGLIDTVTGAARRVGASDILILVRSRGPIYEAMTRALRRRRIAFAGADRLRLSEHLAVLDLVSAGRAALSRDDDLALAEVLKSPLIGLDDDALIALAPGRPGALADVLAASPFRDAAARVDVWRDRARALAPFDFYARLLAADGGRRALIAALGPEAADAIDEFLAIALAFEQSTSPSLSAFLDEVSQSEAEIKRESEAEAAGARVMTVHAAKGLEAPIVFLPDTMGNPQGPRPPRWLAIDRPTPNGPALRIWATKKEEDSAPLRAARALASEIAEGEHRRLLYVALTRAAQKLIVAGARGAKEPSVDCWYRLIRNGLAPQLVEAPARWAADENVWRFADPAPDGAKAETGPATKIAEAPVWLSSAPPLESLAIPFAPSRAQRRIAEDGPAPAAREAGRLAHALIERLPDLAPDARPAAAARYLGGHDGALSETVRAALAGRVLRLIENPDCADLFGPDSRGEVEISGSLPRNGLPPLVISGRLDRLAVLPDRIEVVDFKSSRSARNSDVAQLALYVAALKPLYDKPIRASLAWLDTGELERISMLEIDQVLSKVALTIV